MARSRKVGEGCYGVDNKRGKREKVRRLGHSLVEKDSLKPCSFMVSEAKVFSKPL